MKSSLFSLFLLPFLAVSVFPLAAQMSVQEEDEAKKAYFESFRKKKKSQIPDLLITANYQSCAILAAIARKEKKTPCILLPAAGDRKGKIWFIPAKNAGILPVAEKDLGKFISFLAPERIIVLGDELIVPEKCRPLSTHERPTVSILSANWRFNALILGNLLAVYDMQKQYDEAMKNNVTEPFCKGLAAPEKKKEEKKVEKTSAKKKEVKEEKKVEKTSAKKNEVKEEKKTPEKKLEVKEEKKTSEKKLEEVKKDVKEEKK